MLPFTLFAFSIFGYPGLLVLGAGAGAVGLGAWAFSKDTQAEQRRLHAIEISRELTLQGFDYLPTFFDAYAVGDYSGMASQIKHAYTYLKNDTNRNAMLDAFLKKQLDRAINDPERRDYVLKTVAEWQAKDQARADKEFAAQAAVRGITVSGGNTPAA